MAKRKTKSPPVLISSQLKIVGRSRGRPRGINPSADDWHVVCRTEKLASEFGIDFDTALKRAIPILKSKGFLTQAAAPNTHAQRLRRIKRHLDAGHPLRGLASLYNLFRKSELRHKK